MIISYSHKQALQSDQFIIVKYLSGNIQESNLTFNIYTKYIRNMIYEALG